VSGVTGTRREVTATLRGVTHTFTRDIDILLVGPGGQRTLLCPTLAATPRSANVTLTFDDSAPAGPLPSTGRSPRALTRRSITVRRRVSSPAPSGPYASSLSVFNGINANGSWRSLSLMDSGRIRSHPTEEPQLFHRHGGLLRGSSKSDDPPLRPERAGELAASAAGYVLESTNALNSSLSWPA